MPVFLLFYYQSMAILNESSLPNSGILFLHQTRIRSQIIYSVTLIAIAFMVSSLPFIYINISINSNGVLQSNLEKTEIIAPINGRIKDFNLKDNQKVEIGAVLLSIDATLPKEQSNVLGMRFKELLRLQKDAKYVINALERGVENGALQTGLYAASWQQFREQNQNAANAKEQALKVYKRYEILYTKKVVTQAEYEQYKFNYEQAYSEWLMVTRRYRTQWQTELNQYRNGLKDLQNQKIQLVEQEKLYTLNSPTAGSIQNLTGVQVGSLVYVNQKIGEISPDTALLAFCYVKPSDIGLIRKGQEAKFQIETFNYNQWGVLIGKVTDISNDIVMVQQVPYFKVKCKLDKNFLQLKNGYKGYVKKGMSFRANFTISKRSLYQLLYDKADDWLNPNLS